MTQSDDRHRAAAQAITEVLVAHSSVIDARIDALERRIEFMQRQQELRRPRSTWRQLRAELRAEWDNLNKPYIRRAE